MPRNLSLAKKRELIKNINNNIDLHLDIYSVILEYYNDDISELFDNNCAKYDNIDIIININKFDNALLVKISELICK